MTVPWSLTTTAPDRIDTTIGIADDQTAAVTAVLAAPQDAIDAARLAAAPTARYELRGRRAGGDHRDRSRRRRLSRSRLDERADRAHRMGALPQRVASLSATGWSSSPGATPRL